METTAGEDRSGGRTARMGLRATPKQQKLIQQAAEALNKSVTEFVLESACNAAENALLNQRLFMMEEKDWQTFNALLDRPAEVKPGLKELMKEKAPWE